MPFVLIFKIVKQSYLQTHSKLQVPGVTLRLRPARSGMYPHIWLWISSVQNRNSTNSVYVLSSLPVSLVWSSCCGQSSRVISTMCRQHPHTSPSPTRSLFSKAARHVWLPAWPAPWVIPSVASVGLLHSHLAPPVNVTANFINATTTKSHPSFSRRKTFRFKTALQECKQMAHLCSSR